MLNIVREPFFANSLCRKQIYFLGYVLLSLCGILAQNASAQSLKGDGDFGSLELGKSSNRIFTFFSPTFQNVDIVGIKVNGTDFSLAKHNCPKTLGESSSCDISVNFAPKTEGSKSGLLQVDFDPCTASFAKPCPDARRISLSGIALIIPTAEITSPADDVAISEGESVDFAGAAEQTMYCAPTAFNWNFDGGAASSTALKPGLVIFEKAGKYNVTLTAKYETPGGSKITCPVSTRTDSVTVLVEPRNNNPPNAADDSSKTLSGTPLTIDVLANDSDPDGDPLSLISVSKPSAGQGTAQITNNQIQYDPQGFVGQTRFPYTVSDGLDSSTANVSIEVIDPNVDAAPTIKITAPPQASPQIARGQSVSFASDSSSANPNFNPGYSWNFSGGSPSSSTQEDPGSVTFITVGKHIVTVTVTDQSNGKSASDSVSVEVIDPDVDAAPTIAITAPSQAPQITAGQSVSFTSQVNSANPNFSPSYSWNFPGGSPSSSNQEDPGSVTFNTVGTHTVTATVTDQSNGKTASDSVSVDVIDPIDPNVDAAPNITITSPNQSPQINPGQSVSFASGVSSANPNFDPLYKWDFPDATPSSSNQKNPGNVTFNTIGSHSVTVTVTDQSNGQSDSDSVLVTVSESTAPEDEITLSSDNDSRAKLDLGPVAPDSPPLEQGLEVANGASDLVEIEQISVSGKGFDLSQFNLLSRKTYYSKAGEPLDACTGRKATSALLPGQRCQINVTFDPGNLPPGLHAGLLKIETSLGERIVELLADVDGPKTLFDGGRLLNISTNGFVSLNGMVAGFIVSGTDPRRFVIMGENQNGLSDPELMLSDFTGDIVYGSNDNWLDHPSAAQIEDQLRAPAGMQDAAFAITLEPGVYLAWLSGKNGQTGQGIVSVTDISAPPEEDATRLLNISTNSQVSRSIPLIAGFIVSGLEPVKFVIMGEREGSNSALNPRLRLTDINDEIEYASNSTWQDHPSANDVLTGDRAPRSPVDAAVAITLEPGVYLAWLESEDGQAGQGLISITEAKTN